MNSCDYRIRRRGIPRTRRYSLYLRYSRRAGVADWLDERVRLIIKISEAGWGPKNPRAFSLSSRPGTAGNGNLRVPRDQITSYLRGNHLFSQWA